MKKFLFIITFISMFFNACTSTAISHKAIDEALGEHVKNVKIKKLHLDNSFYNFHAEYIESVNKTDSLRCISEALTKETQNLLYYAEFYSWTNSQKSKQFLNKSEKYMNRSKIELDYLKKQIDYTTKISKKNIQVVMYMW